MSKFFKNKGGFSPSKVKKEQCSHELSPKEIMRGIVQESRGHGVHRRQRIVRSRWCDEPYWPLLWQQNSTAAIWRSFARHSQWAHFGKRTEGGGINEPCRKRSTGFFQFCVWLLLHQKQQAPSCIEMREEAYNWGGSWCTRQTEDFWEHLMRILLSRILEQMSCGMHLREE